MARVDVEDGTALSQAAVDELRARVLGRVLVSGDDGYDPARRIWNGMIDRRPRVIVQCFGAADVIDAVRFARQHELEIAVRGGGHSAAGLSVCDDGIMIDLSYLKAVHVDPVAQTAWAQGGALWEDFDRETMLHGFATTGGMVSNTGIGGLTLGGGIGWLMGLHGLTCDSVISADVVTADGDLITASADSHSDLLWALKGGGGNFGIAVGIEYRLMPVPPQVLGGMVLHRREDGRDMLRFYREFCATLPDAAEAEAMIVTEDDGEAYVGMLLGYNGPIEEGLKVLAPARDYGNPVHDSVEPMTYVHRQRFIDAKMRIHGNLRYWKSGLTPTLSDELIDVLLAHTETMLSPLSFVGIFFVHGAAGRVESAATAFGSRGDEWDIGLVSQWTDPDESPANVAWTRSIFGAVEPFLANGVYVNHIAADEPHRVALAYGGNYERLLAVKNRYDPQNVFHLNHNIRPLTS